MSERDFFWNLFFTSGSIDAYLLIKKGIPTEDAVYEEN